MPSRSAQATPGARPCHRSPTPPDVDANAPPAPLPAFADTTRLALGTVRFDADTTLVTCPTQPPQTSPTPAAYQNYLHWLDLLEEARDLGVSGETDPPSQQYH